MKGFFDMKSILKRHSLIFVAILIALVFSAFAFADEVTEGYVIAKGGKETNIKWQITKADGEVVLSFDIDSDVKDKMNTTVLYGVNVAKGTLASYGEGATVAWGAYQNSITQIKVGDGITGIEGGIANSFSALKTVEIPRTLKEIIDKTFVGETNLVSIYYRGDEPKEGLADLSTLTKLGSYVFDNCKKLTEVKLSESYSDKLDTEVFKWTALKSFTVPRGVTAIGKRALGYCKNLTELWCYAENYTLDPTALDQCDKLAYVYGIAGTPLEAWCKEKDISFRDINSPDTYIYKSTKEPEIFDPTGATSHGHIINMWNGNVVVDTYWLYYEETKTLRFISNKSGHNETGNCDYDKENKAWDSIKNDIEHVIIGKGISKISQKAFQNMTSLKDVEIRGTITQIDANAFNGCKSLTSITPADKQKAEGTADLSTMTKIGDNVFKDTALIHFILAAKTPTLGNNVFPGLTASIKCTPDDSLLAFAVENFVDIIDVTTGETISKNYVYIDQSLPFCGSKAVFSFDEASGTLTVSGVGPIGDTINYYGGGSKNQFWFSFKQQIKKVIIEDGITAIGKYAFTQCQNLEYVEIPDKAFVIGNGAFEKCENLKSIYRRGNEPIIGHLDLSRVSELNSWTFSACYLIANASISSDTAKIGASVFDTCPNLSGIYGTVGSYAEEFASENSFSFFDASSAVPTDTVCEKPAETTEAAPESEKINADESGKVTEAETAADTEKAEISDETELVINLEFVEDDYASEDDQNGQIIPVIIISAAAIIIALVIVIVIKKRNK